VPAALLEVVAVQVEQGRASVHVVPLSLVAVGRPAAHLTGVAAPPV